MTSPVTAEMGDGGYKVTLCLPPPKASLVQTAARVLPGERSISRCSQPTAYLWSNADAESCVRWTPCCNAVLSLLQVAFVMPSKYTAQNIPKPKNAKVEIKPVEAHTLAALSFRCRPLSEPLRFCLLPSKLHVVAASPVGTGGIFWPFLGQQLTGAA